MRIGLLVSVFVAPTRVARVAVETAGEIARLLAEQLQALASPDITAQEALGPKASQTRGKLIRLAKLVDEAAHERLAWFGEVPDGLRLLQALRRVRHDVYMLRRTAREAGGDSLHDRVAAAWQRAAETGASTLSGISQLLAGQHVSEDFNKLAPAVRAHKAEVDEMRRTGATQALSTPVLSRLLGLVSLSIISGGIWRTWSRWHEGRPARATDSPLAGDHLRRLRERLRRPSPQAEASRTAASTAGAPPVRRPGKAFGHPHLAQ